MYKSGHFVREVGVVQAFACVFGTGKELYDGKTFNWKLGLCFRTLYR